MFRQGARVAELTKKVGQVARTGKVVSVRDRSVEVRWDDGHVSVTSTRALTPVKKDG